MNTPIKRQIFRTPPIRLSQSFISIRSRIKNGNCGVSVQTPEGKWYHTNNPIIINARVRELTQIIDRLQEKEELENETV